MRRVLLTCLIVAACPVRTVGQNPDFHWDFSAPDFASSLGGVSSVSVHGSPAFVTSGPMTPEFPHFPSGNAALKLDGRSWLSIDDPGNASPFDFASGDVISLEAWVRPESIREGQQVYILGKGRTNNSLMSKDNQNWGFRLRGMSGIARPSFLFRSADVPAMTDPEGKVTTEGKAGELHRWNADLGIEPDGLWHHIAISFRFGDKAAPVAWVDGQSTDGTWDLGGKTSFASPYIDNDQVWIGSSLGGNADNCFHGSIDEISLFRRVLTDAEIQSRWQTTRTSHSQPEIADSDLPAGSVLFDVREFARLSDPWNRDRTRITMHWQQPVAAITALPRKYADGGLIEDRTNPSILRMRCRFSSPEVTTQFLIRARSAARLKIDGQEVATLVQAEYASDGHQEVPVPPEPLYEYMHPVPAGDQEALVPVTLTAGIHLVEFEALIGGKNMRVEASETLVATGSTERGFELLSPSDASYGLNERDWQHFAEEQRRFVSELEQQERSVRGQATTAFWNQRHNIARELTGTTITALGSSDVDQILLRGLENQSLAPMPVVDDMTFLRRLTLNTVGVIPSRDEITWFLERSTETRRRLAINRFLADSRWADHWVAYWQDVLAENPGILKPELNNSGPFRWWIHESFVDNKPTDRFATELVMMKGSRLGGGPAGFAMASQNDVPLADRALVLSAAFNARDMKCARCHDSPNSDVTQQQLFEFAAMLGRSSIRIPATSSVPKGPNGERSDLIRVSVEPGTSIAPAWPFASAVGQAASLRDFPDMGTETGSFGHESALLQNPHDSREQAALHLTHPTQSVFAQVMVNRLWERLFGQGLMSGTDNLPETESTHRELLEALARQHIADGYDLKKTAALVLNTQAWQRQAAPADAPLAKLFGATTMRRMTAEQLLDSLYAAVGKSFDAEMLTLDPEGRRPDDTFLNLGVPRRAWQFCSLSNERDRPALALPVTQSLVDLLAVFGWRESRPNSVSSRDDQATVLQPLTLANGNAGHRLIQLSDGAATTDLALTSQQPGELVAALFRQILSREPSAVEQSLFAEELTPGFTDRVVPGIEPPSQPAIRRNTVSWSNHLNKEATRIKQELEESARLGDAPTKRLTESWRTQAEDVIWVLLNSPEFAFVP